ncbi:MAG: response regulator [Deltaproteobacteria bacterium]|nr:response regulator [Deltaproteobacteria bacterium]
MPKVLLVDDSSTIQKVAKLILKGSAYSLLSASDIETAQALAMQEKPEIAVIDFKIGNQNGMELIKRIKNNPATSHIKTALLGAGLEESTIQSESGVDGCLSKPFHSKEFLELLRLLYEKSKAQAYTDEMGKIPAVPEQFKKDTPLEKRGEPPLEVVQSVSFSIPEKGAALFNEKDLEEAFSSLEKTVLSKEVVVSQPVSQAEFIQAFSKETIEKMCREIIPPLAEKIIRQEIQKIIREKE